MSVEVPGRKPDAAGGTSPATRNAWPLASAIGKCLSAERIRCNSLLPVLAGIGFIRVDFPCGRKLSAPRRPARAGRDESRASPPKKSFLPTRGGPAGPATTPCHGELKTAAARALLRSGRGCDPEIPGFPSENRRAGCRQPSAERKLARNSCQATTRATAQASAD